ncbi:GD22932 [Drosophila simulans]|uniref:GD22932 n=1 Tax=Drosophila simulans TaxID=7240 RepID=B4Q6M0_DROSI|nr:GD22932 [Drosophila simulans]
MAVILGIGRAGSTDSFIKHGDLLGAPPSGKARRGLRGKAPCVGVALPAEQQGQPWDSGKWESGGAGNRKSSSWRSNSKSCIELSSASPGSWKAAGKWLRLKQSAPLGRYLMLSAPRTAGSIDAVQFNLGSGATKC